MKSKRFVEVLWLDAQGSAAWTSDKEAQSATSPVVTTRGWIVKRDKKILVLAMGYHDDDWLNLFTIPAGMIQKVTRL
jgi:hypothetical protein